MNPAKYKTGRRVTCLRKSDEINVTSRCKWEMTFKRKIWDRLYAELQQVNLGILKFNG